MVTDWKPIKFGWRGGELFQFGEREVQGISICSGEGQLVWIFQLSILQQPSISGTITSVFEWM